MTMATKQSDRIRFNSSGAPRRAIGARRPNGTPKPKERPMQKGRVHRAKSRG